MSEQMAKIEIQKKTDKQVPKEAKKLLNSNIGKRSPAIEEQVTNERPPEEKRQKLTADSVIATETEEVWRLENLAKVMDKIDDYSVGHRGYDIYDKRRKKTLELN